MAPMNPAISNVAVIGFGTMGQGIAQSFAEGGLTVRVVDQNPDAWVAGREQILANLQLAKSYQLITEQPADVVDRITGFTWDELNNATENCSLVIETVPELLEVKKEVFTALDSLPSDVIVGSNTSSFTVTQMTDHITTASRVVGVHYFNPAHLIPAVEIHHGSETSEQTILTVIDIMKQVGKLPVRVRKEVPGFIINRLTGAMEREVDFLLDNGVVTPEDLDAAVRASFGFRLACLGPMESEDFIGLDTAYRVSNNVYKGLSNATEATGGLADKVERGELGVKSGKGWYDYSGKTKAEVFAARDLKLMQQLALYKANNNGSNAESETPGSQTRKKGDAS